MMVRVLNGTPHPQRKKLTSVTAIRRNSSFEHNNLAEEGLCFSEPAPNAAAVNVGLC